MTIFNLLATILLSCVTAVGVLLAFGLFHYLDWKLFMAGNEILFIGDDGFFATAFLIGLFFVSGILLGTIFFSFIRLSMRIYVILCYLTGVLSLFFLLPFALKIYAPTVEVTSLGILALSGVLPILGLIFAIGSSQKRKERRREMTMEERRREDWDEERRADFNRQAIFPWIKTRKKPLL